jgi:pilus assembly protein TadC
MVVAGELDPVGTPIIVLFGGTLSPCLAFSMCMLVVRLYLNT